GLVRFSKSRDIEGRILHTTVRRNPSGKYFISILVETEVQPLDKTETSIGIDLGITVIVILSDGRKVNNNKFTVIMKKKLKKEQRKLSRRAIHAKNNDNNLLNAKQEQKQKIKVT